MRPATSQRPSWSEVRLHVITGKGGTGKTTVACALALGLAAQGRRVLVAEVEARQGISQTLDVAPLPNHETMVTRVAGGGELWGLSVDPKASLLEYLDLFYHLGRAGKALEKLGAIDFATTIAPGVRDVLSIGKVYDATRRRGDKPRPDGSIDWAYDTVVLDAPPTGRVTRFLNVTDEVADLAKMGPIRGQANSVTSLLTSDASLVHVVTLLEEMPVQEASDAIGDLREVGFPLGSVIVNQARDPLLSSECLDQAEAGALDLEFLAAQLAEFGIPNDPQTVHGLAEEAKAHAERMSLEGEQLAVVESLELPVFMLPVVPEGVNATTVRQIAHSLAEQANW